VTVTETGAALLFVSVKVTVVVPAETAVTVNEVPFAGDTVATPVLAEFAAKEPA